MALVEVHTSDLSSPALDWLMATIEDLPILHDPMGFKSGSEAGYWVWDEKINGVQAKIGREYSPSTHWSQLGPLIMKYLGGEQLAVNADLPINASRAIATLVLGHTVRVPSELII